MTTTFYKLHHATDNTKECYVGSTGDLTHRKRQHRYCCKRYNLKVYSYMRDHGGYNAWAYSILEERTELMSKIDRLKRERELTTQHNANLNTQWVCAWIEAGSRLEYQRMPQQKEVAKRRHQRDANTDNICERCRRTYRGKTNKAQHQQSLKCKQLTRTRVQEQIQILIEQMEMYQADTISRIEGFKSELQTLVVEGFDNELHSHAVVVE